MNDSHEVATVSKRDLATMDFSQALEVYTPNFAAELPSHIPVERFKRTIITALNMSPDLRNADRRSLFNAAVKCAHDGLYPDGREAALVVFSTKTKNEGGQDVWIKAVQYMPMIQGIRKRMRNTGDVLSATAEVVYRNDRFRYVKGEDPHIEHEPPAIDKDRGDAVGAYAIIKLANGEVLREVMGRPEIERARAVSKSGQKPESPWVKWWDEMARKTVLRRCAKSAPTGSDLERLLSRDDEAPELPPLSEMKVIPDRPQREDFDEPSEPESDKSFAVTAIDGEVHEFDEAEDAARMLRLLLQDGAHTRREVGIEAIWEDNAGLIAALRYHGHGDLADDIRDNHYAALLAEARGKPASPDDPAGAAEGAGAAARTPPAAGQRPLGVTASTSEFDSESPGSNPGGAATAPPPPIEIVKPHGGKADYPATRERLVAAFVELPDIGACDAFRKECAATINALRHFAPDEGVTFDDVSAAYERTLRGGEA